MSGNLKLVIDVSDTEQKVTVQGIEDGCDPKVQIYRDLDLPQALERVPPLVIQWQEGWAEQPRNPDYKKPRAPRKPAATTQAAPDPAPEVTTTADLPLLADSPETPAETQEEKEPEMSSEKPEEQSGPEPGQLPHLQMEREPDENGAPASPEPEPVPEPEPEPEPAPTPAVTSSNVGKYTVDGKGSFETVHDALRAMGVTDEDIGNHKYWHRVDRLPKAHAERISKVV